MHLQGTLRQRGNDLFLDEQLSQEVGSTSNWATQRRYQLLATPSTQGEVHTHVNELVTITGSPHFVVERDRIFMVLATIAMWAPDAHGG
jgi:hypothetical protein